MKLPWLDQYNLLIFDNIDSTNSESLRLVKANILGDFIILTRNQTAGRGQRSRQWQSLPGNLHFSILKQVDFDLQKSIQLSFLAANAINQTINYFAKKQNIKLKIQLKWPNDVLIDGKKIAGILLESIKYQNANFIIIGIGVNVNQHPSNLSYVASSLKDQGIIIENSDDFLYAFMNNFDKLFKYWDASGNFNQVQAQWLKYAHNLNKVITISSVNSRISGIFKGINHTGEMVLELAEGDICHISAGEVIYDDKQHSGNSC